MKIRVGIDFQSIDDVEASIGAFGNRYLERVYTRHEIESCSRDAKSSARAFADRFAAKEAVMKVLDVGDLSMAWRSIEIQMDPRGGSAVSLSGSAAERATHQGVEKLSVSVSHTERLATAVAVGEFVGLEHENMGTR
jgi:holo-[acyl-carrier protein] synthase